jgi:cytochrome c biogenesis protein
MKILIKIFKVLITFFTSIRLAIILLIILAVASVLGTLIPQQRSLEEYAARYGQLSGFLIRLQLTRLYHSIWYLALLAFFALNIIVCTLTRLSAKWRKAVRPHIKAEAKSLLALKIKDRYKKSAPLSAVKAELEKSLASSRYRLRTAEKGSRVHLLGRKKILGIFGSDVVHLGLLIILAGGIVSGLASIRKELVLKEGETLPVPKASFELRLDKFTTEYYPDGSVKAWKSAVAVMEDKKPVLTKTIVVNRPLTYRGYSFYQTSYGWNWDNPSLEIWTKKKSDPAFLKKLKLKVGEKAQLDDKDQTSISVARFIPDFVLGEGNEPQTRSLQPNNPAALVEGSQGGEKIFSGWIFANFPDMDRIHAAKPTDLSFELKSFEAGQYSVLEAAKDPGAILIWIGCALTMIGLGLAFYWPTWEIRAVLEESQGKTEVIVGGIAAKSRESLQSEFEKIVAAARRSK